LAATAGDVHPPAYYLLLKAWLVLWPASIRIEVAARFLSFVLSLVALVLYARVLRMLDLSDPHRRAAWVIVLFLPSLVYYAAEARMYTLLMCYVLAAYIMLGGSHVRNARFSNFVQRRRYGDVRQLRAGIKTPAQAYAPGTSWVPQVRPQTFHLPRLTPQFGSFLLDLVRGACGGTLILGAALTHNAGIVWGGLILVVLWVWGDKFTRALCEIAAGIAVIGYTVSWLPMFVGQLFSTRANYWTWANGLGTAAYMQFLSLFYSPHIPDNGVDALLMFLVGGLTTWGVVALARKQPRAAALATGFPLAALVGSKILGVSFLLHRLMVPGAFFVAIAWGALLTRDDVGRVLAVLLTVAMVYLNVLALTKGRTACTYNAVLDAIRKQPADVLYGNNSAIVPVSLYSGVPAAIMDGYADPLGSGLSDQTLNALGVASAQLEDLDWKRAWVLWFGVPGSTEHEARYMESLITRYDGAEIVPGLGDERFTTGGLYLLERGDEWVQH